MNILTFQLSVRSLMYIFVRCQKNTFLKISKT